MIAAAGLHTVDIHNGTGWTYTAGTGKIGWDSHVWDVASNVYSDNSGIYFASKDLIARINKDDGQAIWLSLLPADLPSKSALFANDKHVFMVNYGYAFSPAHLYYGRIVKDAVQLNYGTPFFAAFDKENGEQLFLSTINITRNPVLNFKIKNDYLLLVFKDRIIKYSLSDGAQTVEKTINNRELGELRGFVGSHIYTDAANSYLANLALSDVSKNYITSSSRREQKILIFDDDLNFVGDIDTEQLYEVLLKTGDYLLVTNGNKSFVLDADNKKIAEIDAALSNPVLIEDKLYSVRENSFFEIDLSKLLKR